MRIRFAEVVLAIATIVWGATFLATRTALAELGPFSLLLIRFAIGAGLLALVARGRPSKADLRAAALIGAVTLVGYATQTYGLLTVSSAKSAFITALYVPLVPLLQAPMTGSKATRAAWLGAGLSFLGLGVLSVDDGLTWSFGLGEALTVVCSFAAAVQIILIGKYASGGNPVRATALQLGFVALGALAFLPAELPAPVPGALTWSLAVGLGVFATAGALLAMNWAQRTVPPGHATLIYAMEPVWAALFGALAGESVRFTAIAGGILVLAGILVCKWMDRERPNTEQGSAG